jgi:hypothetical protein
MATDYAAQARARKTTSTRDSIIGLAILGGGVYLAARIGGKHAARDVVRMFEDKMLAVNMTLPAGYKIVKEVL